MPSDLSSVERFRESHHAVARMVALDMTPALIRQRTGITSRRLTLLCSDPSFQELVVIYRQQVEEAWTKNVDTYLDLGMSNMIRAEAQISDHFDKSEDEGELLPIPILDKISQGRADRFGYSKHQTVDVNHDFASLMDKAIARSGKQVEGPASPKLIEAQAVPHPDTRPEPHGEAEAQHPAETPSSPRSLTNVLLSTTRRRKVF